MTEQKFNPVQEFIHLRDQLSRAIGQGLKNAAGITAAFPAVDIYETEDAVMLRTEPLFGVVASSIEVNMEGEMLVLRGETKPDEEIDESAYLQRELTFGTFSREVSIPRPVKPEAAKASLKGGMLTIRLPKTTPAASRVIEVTSGE